MITALPAFSAAPTCSWMAAVSLLPAKWPTTAPGSRTDGHRAEHRRGEQAHEHAGATTGTAAAEVVAGVHQPGLAVGSLADQDHAVARQLLGRDLVGQCAELLLGDVDVGVAGDDEHLGVAHGAPLASEVTLPGVARARLGDPPHDGVRVPADLQDAGHHGHRLVDVPEEALVARRRGGSARARRPGVAMTDPSGSRRCRRSARRTTGSTAAGVALGVAEGDLLRRVDELEQGAAVGEVAERGAAGSTKWSQEYTSPLCSRASARPQVSCVDAEAEHGYAQPMRERRVEGLDEDAPDVAADPLVEHVDEEPPVGVGGRTVRVVTPSPVRLDDRDELDELRAQVVAEESVDLPSAPGARWR